MRPLELEDLVPIRPWRKFPPLLPLSVDLIPAIHFGTVSDDHSYHRYYGFWWRSYSEWNNSCIMNNSFCVRRCIMNKISLLLKMNKPIYFSFYHKPRKQPLHKNYISRQITPFYKQARNLWGYGVSHPPPPLKFCHFAGQKQQFNILMQGNLLDSGPCDQQLLLQTGPK